MERERDHRDQILREALLVMDLLTFELLCVHALGWVYCIATLPV